MDVDQLVADLTKPMYVYRMARAKIGNTYLFSDSLRRSAAKSKANAEKQIEDIVRRAVAQDQ